MIYRRCFSVFIIASCISVAILESTEKGRGCYYKGAYHHGNWFDGCEFNCTCLDSVKGHYKCQTRCPVYTQLPPGCVLKMPSGEECCKQPDCRAITSPLNNRNSSGGSNGKDKNGSSKDDAKSKNGDGNGKNGNDTKGNSKNKNGENGNNKNGNGKSSDSNGKNKNGKGENGEENGTIENGKNGNDSSIVSNDNAKNGYNGNGDGENGKGKTGNSENSNGRKNNANGNKTTTENGYIPDNLSTDNNISQSFENGTSNGTNITNENSKIIINSSSLNKSKNGTYGNSTNDSNTENYNRINKNDYSSNSNQKTDITKTDSTNNINNTTVDVDVNILRDLYADILTGNGHKEGCYYRGEYHLGDWTDGCDFNCTCEDPVIGIYRCRKRCKDYTTPLGCELRPSLTDSCCLIPFCETSTNSNYFNMTSILRGPHSITTVATTLPPIIARVIGIKNTILEDKPIYHINTDSGLDTVINTPLPTEYIQNSETNILPMINTNNKTNDIQSSTMPHMEDSYKYAANVERIPPIDTSFISVANDRRNSNVQTNGMAQDTSPVLIKYRYGSADFITAKKTEELAKIFSIFGPINLFKISDNADVIINNDIDAATNSNVDAAANNNIHATENSNAHAIANINIHATTNSNVDAAANSNVHTTANYNVDAGANYNVDAASNNNVDIAANNNVDAAANNNVDIVANNNVDVAANYNVDVLANNNVDVAANYNVDFASNNNVDAAANNNVDVAANYNVDVAANNSVDVAVNNNVDAKEKVGENFKTENITTLPEIVVHNYQVSNTMNSMENTTLQTAVVNNSEPTIDSNRTNPTTKTIIQASQQDNSNRAEKNDVNNRYSKVVNTSSESQTEENVLNKSDGVCQYKGVNFTQGERWYDGCDYRCSCDDANRGIYNCRSRCEQYTTVPVGCIVRRSRADTCCLVLDCRSAIVNKYNQQIITPIVLENSFNTGTTEVPQTTIKSGKKARVRLTMLQKKLVSLLKRKFNQRAAENDNVDLSAKPSASTATGSNINTLKDQNKLKESLKFPGEIFSFRPRPVLTKDRIKETHSPKAERGNNVGNVTSDRQEIITPIAAKKSNFSNELVNTDKTHGKMPYNEDDYRTVATETGVFKVRKRDGQMSLVQLKPVLASFRRKTVVDPLIRRTSDVCKYKGYQFKKDDTWVDGCELTCICKENGRYICRKRCPEYRRIPDGCILIPPKPGQCCSLLTC